MIESPNCVNKFVLINDRKLIIFFVKHLKYAWKLQLWVESGQLSNQLVGRIVTDKHMQTHTHEQPYSYIKLFCNNINIMQLSLPRVVIITFVLEVAL